MRQFEAFGRKNGAVSEGNPVEAYDIQEPVERMVAAQKVLDEKARAFLERFKKDEVFEGVLDPDAEWRCWLKGDAKNSLLFFDDALEVFDDAAYDHFVDHYSAEWKDLAREQAAIDKMGKGLDEYQILITSLYNVFNNKNHLSAWDYFTQVFSRMKDYHMVWEKPTRDSMDLLVMFDPLRDVNRGKHYLNHKLYLAHNPDYRKDGYVYSVRSMESVSADKMYSGPVELPVCGAYAKFSRAANERFLEETHSLFYYEALKAHRADVKQEYGIPADYFEGTYIDTKKLVDFSAKSYQYGNSKIFIPKSQVVLAGDTLYMKRWLYYKLKNEVEEFEKAQPDLEKAVEEAKKVAGAACKDSGSVCKESECR